MTSKSLSTEGSRGYLLDFSCENYCSMRDRQTLSLVADKSSHLAESLIDLPDQNIRVGRVAAIYGANASGKSTVLSALTGAAGIVLDSHAKWRSGQPIPLDTFALGDAKDVSASSFNFVLGGVRYHYEFSMSRERVVHEELNAWPTHRRQRWFERKGDSFKFGKQLEGNNEQIKVLVRKNSLFLSTAAQNNHPTLQALYSFFDGIVVRPTRSLPSFGFDEEPSDDVDEPLLRSLLRAADLGIENVRSKEVNVRRGPDGEVFAKAFQLEFLHRGKTSRWLPAWRESTGTKMIVDFARNASEILRRGSVLIVDELDRSMHPLLTRELVAAFQSRESNPLGAQLVFSAHDTSLLDPDLLRRDQIWFTEKDSEGATTLKPFTDYHARGKENFGARYLEGRYGAVPFPAKFNLTTQVE
jgi:uncharacterized protein